MRNLVSFVYTYGNADQRTRVTREDGRVIHYEYDAIGQLTNASGGVYQYGYQYDETGNPIRQDKGGFIASNTFNHLNQNVESDFYGALSVWGTKQGPLPATVSVNSIMAQSWGLTGWNASGHPFTQGTNLLTTIIADIAGRSETNLTQAVVQDKVYEHDLNGNMTRNGDFEYIWDDENRLIGVKRAGEWLQQNRYDGLSRRVEKIEYIGEEVVTNRYVYDEWNVIAVVDGGNGILEPYMHGIDLSGEVEGAAGGVGGILSVSINGAACVYHYDGNGNISLTTDESGVIISHLEYSPFGDVLICSGTYTPHYSFSSKEQDAATGMSYYGYRFYNPQSGRWINRDPIAETGRMNLYEFVKNTPQSKYDILGLACGEWEDVGSIYLKFTGLGKSWGNNKSCNYRNYQKQKRTCDDDDCDKPTTQEVQKPGGAAAGRQTNVLREQLFLKEKCLPMDYALKWGGRI